jgi:hypothetical protein
MLRYVENVEQVIENIKTIEQYLNSENTVEKEFARDLIKKGRAMLIYKVKGENHFAPLRFLGFKSNSRSEHIDNENRENRDPAPAIQSIMGKPFTTPAMEKEFNDYAAIFKGHTLKSKRKYWRVRDEDNKYFELDGVKEALVGKEI